MSSVTGGDDSYTFDMLKKDINNAHDGDTINLPEGRTLIFPESIVIDKSLNIVGNGLQINNNNLFNNPCFIIKNDNKKINLNLSGIRFFDLIDYPIRVQDDNTLNCQNIIFKKCYGAIDVRYGRVNLDNVTFDKGMDSQVKLETHDSSLNMNNCSAKGNIAIKGPVVHAYGRNNAININSCNFDSNNPGADSPDSLDGGVIYMFSTISDKDSLVPVPRLNVINSTFINNHVRFYGGCIATDGSDGYSVTLENNIFNGNSVGTTNSSGSCLYASGYKTFNYNLIGNKFMNNKDANDVRGFVMGIWGCSCNIYGRNNTIDDNGIFSDHIGAIDCHPNYDLYDRKFIVDIPTKVMGFLGV
jgi:hypothetical protein